MNTERYWALRKQRKTINAKHVTTWRGLEKLADAHFIFEGKAVFIGREDPTGAAWARLDDLIRQRNALN